MYSTIKNWIANIIYLLKMVKLWNLKDRNCFRILLYHNIGEKSYSDRLGLKVPLENFRKQMRFLHSNGYKVFPLKELIYKVKRKEAIPAKSIAITFDDGHNENLASILNIFDKYNFVASFFVTIDYIEGSAAYSKKEYWEHFSFFTWDELKSLLGSGNDIGSHFCSHKNLLTLSPERIREEIIKSKYILKDRLGIYADLFSYPYGKFNGRIGEDLKKSGCLAACSSILGKNDADIDLFALRRIPINSWDGIFEFKKKLTGCYDWVKFIRMQSTLF